MSEVLLRLAHANYSGGRSDGTVVVFRHTLHYIGSGTIGFGGGIPNALVQM
jgi:hypothetical protein